MNHLEYGKWKEIRKTGLLRYVISRSFFLGIFGVLYDAVTLILLKSFYSGSGMEFNPPFFTLGRIRFFVIGIICFPIYWFFRERKFKKYNKILNE